ncbi:MAG TPA: hypothetical protein VLK36_11310 [Gaiellaceae bacterium]|nr:hypothetical protein [Gaiellaceae bacterium]
MREPAPPYAGEGPHALWHVSEDPGIARFAPHHREGHAEDEPLVWAVDTRHLPLYWFPRECPRGTFWAHTGTTAADVHHFLDGDRSRRVHALEATWLDAFRDAQVHAYRLPPEPFEPYPPAGGYWISRDPVAPLELVALGDLTARHADAGIELRLVPKLRPLWERVIASSLEFSGIRLRNLAP